MKKNILLSSVAALSILSVGLNAQELESVNVWETEVVSSSVNLGKNAIETKQADHLSDLLRGIPGVDVGGSHSTNNKIIIRGIKDEDLDITIDGAKQSTADMFHHLGTVKINPDILKKVSIEVGANSVVHTGLGGSIEFETKDGKDLLEKGKNFGAMISTNYNSNKSLGASLSVFGKITPASDFFVYYNRVDNENWKNGNGNSEIGRDGEIDNIILKYGIDFLENQRLSFSYDKLSDEGDYLPRPDLSAAVNASINRGLVHPTEYKRDTYTIKHELDKGSSLFLKTSLYFNEMDLTRKEDNTNFARGDVIQGIVKNKGINSKAQSNIESSNILNTLTYGLLYDVQSSEGYTDGAQYGENEEAKTFSVYIEDAIDFNNGLILTPGIRFTNYKLDGLLGNIKENELTYSLATEYAVNDNFSLLASHSTLFKGAPMVEIFASARSNLNSNENIKSETGKNSEIGFKYIKDNILGAQNIGFTAKYFKTTIKDNIELVGYYDLKNVGTTNIRGYEASFIYQLENASAGLSYSHASSLVQNTNKPLDNEVGDKLALNLSYDASSEISLSWKSILVLDEKDIPNIKKEGYSVHDIAVSYTPSAVKGLKIIAGIDNIFDKAYASHSSKSGAVGSYGVNLDTEPGRNIKVTLAYKF